MLPSSAPQQTSHDRFLVISWSWCVFRAMLHAVAAASERMAFRRGEERAMRYRFGDYTLDTERYAAVAGRDAGQAAA